LKPKKILKNHLLFPPAMMIKHSSFFDKSSMQIQNKRHMMILLFLFVNKKSKLTLSFSENHFSTYFFIISSDLGHNLL